MMKVGKWALGLGLLIMTLTWGCNNRTFDPATEGTLEFDQDTVKFDTIFTTLQAPSKRLIVYNKVRDALAIERVWLDLGAASEFSLIVDGIRGDDVSDLVINGRDSMHVFVTMKSQERDNFAQDYINFQVGGEVQRVLIQAFVLDAYFLQARLLQPDVNSLAVQGFVFDNDTTLTPDKPIVVDGPVLVLPGVTVTVLPGTQLFFTPYKFGVRDTFDIPTFVFFSTLIVYGTLNAEGTAQQPIVFTGSRLDSNYRENPAQWRGIRFGATSKDNVLRHVQVRNALVGLQVDSLSVNNQPKLRVQYSEVRNMGAYGVWGLGFDESGNAANTPPMLLMENSIVTTCKERTFFAWGGGHYQIFNCTFGNFNLARPRFSRRTPQVAVGNYYIDPFNRTLTIYPCIANFTNCVLWGSEEDEFVLDTVAGYPAENVRLNHCLIRTSADYAPFVTPHYTNCLVNQDPLFNDFMERDYRPKNGSPVINAGISFPAGSSGYADDYRGRSDSLRYDGFDIGAWEWWPIED